MRPFVLALVLALTTPVRGTVPTQGSVSQNGTKVWQFLPTEVRLLDGPFRDAMLRDQQYLLALDPDRLLHTFRAERRAAVDGTAARRLGSA